MIPMPQSTLLYYVTCFMCLSFHCFKIFTTARLKLPYKSSNVRKDVPVMATNALINPLGPEKLTAAVNLVKSLSGHHAIESQNPPTPTLCTDSLRLKGSTFV